MVRFVLAAFVCLMGLGAQAETVRMAVTTSFHNSGLADVLLPALREDTDIRVDLLVVGTGQALGLGRTGDVDAILVHSKKAEQEFVSKGFASHRREVMYNDFVILGPSSDPAGIKNKRSAKDALSAIANGQFRFASRGDASGTHKAELAIWDSAAVAPAGGWYMETGSGMGATLNVATATGAYVLADRASWLNFGNKRDLTILVEGDAALFNQYAFLPVSKDMHPHVKRQAVQLIENWLVSDAGQALIGSYQIDGQQLFYPNAKSQ